MLFSTLVVCAVFVSVCGASPSSSAPLAEPDPSLAFSVQADGRTYVNKVRVITAVVA